MSLAELIPEDGTFAVVPEGRAVSRRRRTVLIVLSDMVALVVAVTAGLAVAALVTGKGTSVRTYLLGPIFVANAVLSFVVYGIYTRASRRILVSAHDDLRDILQGLVLGSLLTAGINHITLHAPLRPSQVVAITVTGLFTVPLARSAGVSVFNMVRPERLLILGTGAVAENVARRLSREHDQGIQIAGFVDDDPVVGQTVLGGLADLPRLCEVHSITRVLVAFSRTPPHQTAEILRQLAPSVAISVVPRLYELVCWRSQLDELQGIPIMDIAPPRLTLPARIGKRAFDLAASGLALIVLFPVLVVIAVAVKATSPGPVFFVQRRSGRHGKVFPIYKFRTMRKGSEALRDELLSRSESDWEAFKIKDDPRVTRFGQFLRRMSLDELPQFVNVFLGHMSLVGPRPIVGEELERYEGWAARRLEVRPGLTGLWQVSGRNDLSYAERRALDYAYVASWSFWWDIRILAQTPTTVLKRRGAT